MTQMNIALLNAMARIKALRHQDETGASMAEYGLLLALIAVVALGALTAVGTGVSEKFQEVATALGG